MVLLIPLLRRAAGDLLSPRVLSVMLLPMLAALIVWIGIGWWFGAAWLAWLQGWLASAAMPTWLGLTPEGGVTAIAGGLLLALGFAVAIYLTALLITSLLLMPLLVGVVAQRHFPDLERRHGGSFSGAVGNGVAALAIYLPLALLTLPLWLLGPLGVVASLLLNAWLNRRLFVYDALAEHASVEELARLRRDGGWPVFLLAASLGLLYFVPLLNLFAPTYMGLAFTHYGLDRLARMRRESMA
jgi:CysZ protein